MEGRAVAPGELLQGEQAHVVKHVGAGQQHGLPGALAAARQRCQADGALGGLPLQGLQHRGRASHGLGPHRLGQAEVLGDGDLLKGMRLVRC